MVKSIKAKFPVLFFLSISFALLCFITGCGNKADTGTGSNTTTTSSPSVSLGLSSSVVSYGTPVTATATVRDSSGSAVSGAVVTFTATSGLVTFNPTSATALTNTSGIATVSLNAASIDSAGATSIIASTPVTESGTTTTVTSTPVGVAVNGATISLGAVSLGSSSISAYGTSSVSVPVYVDASPATVPISVTFTSPCVSAGKATLSSPVNSVAGTATSTYKDNGCATGSDVITAAVTGDSKQATIIVATPATNNIQFVSATPTIIGTSTASASSLPTSSVVKFEVVDSSNNGKSGVVVDFSILPVSAPGGITLSATSATSDSSGIVSTSLSSGTVPTPVWVVATVHGTSLKSQSNTLTITTGLPTQDFFSLSAHHNIEGWGYDGVTSAVNIIASDRLGNPVPAGTVINFITEGAHFDNASCSTNANGTCSVNFVSADSRPSDGRVTILAYTLGEKSFVDLNGNNSYNSGETFYDLGDPYIDANENGQWDPGETFISSTTTGTSACLTQPGGTALPYGKVTLTTNIDAVPSKENTCTAAWGQNYVRRADVIILSGSKAFLDDYSALDTGSSCMAYTSRMLRDINHNPMPAGSTITTANNEVYYTYIDSSGNLQTGNATIIIYNTPVPDSNDLGGTEVDVRILGGTNCTNSPIWYPYGTFDLVVTTPYSSTSTSIPLTVTGNKITPSIVLTAGSSSITAGGETTMTATVTDGISPLEGYTVAFSISSNISGATLSATTAQTDNSGQASVVYTAGVTWTPPPATKTDKIKASIGSSSYSVNVSVTP